MSDNNKLKPKAVIFDLGSTLIEYEKIPWDELGALCVSSGRKFLLKKNCDLPDEEEFNAIYNEIRDKFREMARKDMIEWSVPQVIKKLLQSINITEDKDIIDGFFDAYYKPVEESLEVYSDTREVLEKIRNSVPVIGLISNTIFPEKAHLKELRRFNIDSYFDFKIFSSTFGLRKPHEDIFYDAVNKAGYAPSESVYVGDRYLEDIVGPTAIGMHAILKVKKDRIYPEEMPEATRRISTLTELFDHIDISLD